MQESIEGLIKHLYGVWRYRWWALIVAWLVAVIGWTVVSIIPNTYESTTQIYVDTDTILKPLLRGLSVESVDIDEQFGLMTKELLSRPNLERIMQKADLDIHANTPFEKEQILGKLKKDIQISATRTHRPPRPAPPNLFILSARHKNPQKAFKVTQALLDIFLEDSLGGTRAETDSAQRFLKTEIKEYEAKLIAAENQLREFKARNIKLLPEQGTSYYQRLQQAQANLEGVELELREEEFRRKVLVRQLKNASPVQGVVTEDGTTVLSPIDQRITAIQTRLDELLLKYTTNHPDVMEAQHTLAELEKEKKEQMERIGNNSSGLAISQNPAVQALQSSLAEVEANIAALKVRRDEYKSRVEKLQEQVETLPQIEAELKALNRDYDINKQNYDTLVARLEGAKITERVGQTGEPVKVKVIEPPAVPTKPSSPDRFVFSSLVLLLAVSGGIGVAFLLSQIKPVFSDRRTLQNGLDIPVIGTISFSPRTELIKMMRLTMTGFVLMGGFLFVVYVGVIYIQITTLI
jgi:polysaccharide chain length determinant protein (PEP-CTERM system associated)